MDAPLELLTELTGFLVQRRPNLAILTQLGPGYPPLTASASSIVILPAEAMHLTIDVWLSINLLEWYGIEMLPRSPSRHNQSRHRCLGSLFSPSCPGFACRPYCSKSRLLSISRLPSFSARFDSRHVKLALYGESFLCRARRAYFPGNGGSSQG